MAQLRQFKPVGVDQNSRFPDRIEARLEEDFASPLRPINPSDFGLVGWVFDPTYASALQPIGSGTLYLDRIRLLNGTSITKLLWGRATGAASTLCRLGVYSTSGVLLGATANFSSLGDGVITVPLASPLTGLSAGTEYYVASLYIGGGVPYVWSLQNGSGAANALVPAASRRCMYVNGYSDLPANLNLATLNDQSQPRVIGLVNT